MTHLRIELNTITENVTSNVIHKLYETAKAIIDAEEADDVQESLASLKGNLLVSKVYGDEIDWLEAKFPDLHITAGARYIRFADDAVYARLSQYLGDGTGITSSDITNANMFSNNNDPKTNREHFINNTDIVSFNELGQLPQVTSIPYQCFEGCTNLTSIDLQNISSIGFNSFNSANLTGIINLPSLITFTGRNAFTSCKSITEVNFNLSVFTGFGSSTGTFEFCTSLLRVTGLGSITEIPGYTFNGANSLVSVDLSSCTVIGQRAFINCSILESIGTSLGNVSFTGSGTFRECKKLKTFPVTGLTMVSVNSSWLFYNCSELERIGTGSDNVDIYVPKIGDCFMRACSSLTGTLNFPNTTEVSTGNSGGAFSQCPKIEKVSFPALVRLDGGSAWELNYRNTFGGDTMLKVVDVGPNTTYLSHQMFYNNPQMKAFIIRSTTPPEIGDGTTAYNISVMGNSNVNVYVPDSALSTYQSTVPYSGWGSLLKPLSEFDETLIQYSYLQQS